MQGSQGKERKGIVAGSFKELVEKGEYIKIVIITLNITIMMMMMMMMMMTMMTIYDANCESKDGTYDLR